MKFQIQWLSPKEWAVLSRNVHIVIFGKEKPSEWDRIDYALLAVSPEGVPLGYMTCREVHQKLVYWQYGGAFPGVKNTIYSWPIYKAFAEWHQGKYEGVTTYIENTNFPMLKMALKVGFKIIGCRTMDGIVLLEHFLTFEEHKNGEHATAGSSGA